MPIRKAWKDAEAESKIFYCCACRGGPALCLPAAVSVVSAKRVFVWLCSAPPEQLVAVRVAMRSDRAYVRSTLALHPLPRAFSLSACS